jgi:hypothetical protein
MHIENENFQGLTNAGSTIDCQGSTGGSGYAYHAYIRLWTIVSEEACREGEVVIRYQHEDRYPTYTHVLRNQHFTER